jgi:hypothetical protein
MEEKIVESEVVETEVAEPEIVVVAPLEEKPRLPTVAEVVAMFPAPELTPTPRWYGETFYPQYTKALEELKRLAET